MKGKHPHKSVFSYLTGAAAGVVFAVAVLYGFNMAGLISVSAVHNIGLVPFLQWCYANLGLSLIPFILIAVVFFIYLRKLSLVLKQPDPPSAKLFALEEKIDLLATLFFGVGVIWTAIGMRNALLASLGNMDAETAAQKGAFYILTQLVEGGILLSLSTTIVGGIGGYIMRIVKSWATGPGLTAVMEARAEAQTRAVLDRLDRIARLIGDEKETKTP